MSRRLNEKSGGLFDNWKLCQGFGRGERISARVPSVRFRSIIDGSSANVIDRYGTIGNDIEGDRGTVFRCA